MSKELVVRNTPVFHQIHPGIYGAAVGLVAWFAAAAWILFDRQSDIGLPLAMVSVLLLVAVGAALVAVLGLEQAPDAP
jgi:Na+-translocating ferredoxin:NAD+ oxidoreductase RnfD subunit